MVEVFVIIEGPSPTVVRVIFWATSCHLRRSGIGMHPASLST